MDIAAPFLALADASAPDDPDSDGEGGPVNDAGGVNEDDPAGAGGGAGGGAGADNGADDGDGAGDGNDGYATDEYP